MSNLIRFCFKAATTPQFNFPGPGTYSPPDLESSKLEFHRFRSKRRKRLGKELTLAPSLGPGAYSLTQKQFWNSPKFSIPKAKNYDDFLKLKIPGPQHYKINEKPSKANKFSFPKSPKNNHRYINTPGPGAYNPRNPLLSLEGKPTKFALTSRNTIDLNQKNPGPGSYNLKLEKFYNGGPAWTFEQNDKFEGANQKKKWLPGPGSYKIKNSIGDAPYYLFYNIKKKIPEV